MATLHKATLRPTKLELLTDWLPGRPWSRIPAGATLERVATCRFDDPAGEVGIETILLRAGDGPIHHTPLTYRNAPLEGGEAWLVGNAEHSVLGRRWVYDACGDPVYAAALANAILTGAGEAEEFLDGEVRKPLMTVRGSGTSEAAPVVTAVRRVVNHDPTRVETDVLTLAVVRVLDDPDPVEGAAALIGSWPGGTAALAHVL